MNLILLARHWQYIVMLVLVAIITVVSFISHHRGTEISRITAQHELDMITAESNYKAQVLKVERLNNERWQSAVNKNAQMQKRIASDYADTSAIVDSLSDTIDKASAAYIKADADSRAEYTAAISNISKECAGSLKEMARLSDGHVADIRMMQQAWPKN